jgi:hypothetical protein
VIRQDVVSRKDAASRKDVVTRLRASPERGAISALVIVLIVMLFAVAGLIFDGGRAINARQQTFDDVEQAARLAANQIDEDLFRSTGQVQIMEDRAEQEAKGYLLSTGRAWPYEADRISVTFPPEDGVPEGGVRVTAERTVPTGLLQLVFVNSFDVPGTA